MIPSRLRQIDNLYHASLERAVSERAAFLDQACAGDTELRREVASLFAQDVSRMDIKDRPVRGTAAEAGRAGSSVTVFTAGLEIGSYKIESQLGQGGMGVVYKALDTKLNRRVAVKLLSDKL